MNNVGITFGFSGLGGYMICRYFWPKCLGKDVKYAKKSVLIPAIVGIALIAIAVVVIIYASGKLD